MSILLMLTTVALAALATACGSDTIADDTVANIQPQIALTEVGHGNSHQAHPGHDMHLEATIVATGLISHIDVSLQQDSGGYTIDTLFAGSKYAGVRNAQLHEHIDIPADAPLGQYTMRLTVTDQQGRTLVATTSVTLAEGDGDDDDDDDDDDHNEGGSDGKDMSLPVISDQGVVANPVDCQVYHRGDTIPFCYAFSDDGELGSYNIEVHNNFDHHTHSTSATECQQEADKQPVSPWVYNRSFTIPAGRRSYTARVKIAIPAGIDTGDYHFMVRLTDRVGWQQIRSMAIKIE